MSKGKQAKENTKLELLPINSQVKIGEDIDALIHGICIRSNMLVTYECGWWDGNIYNKQWLPESEVKPKSATEEKITIGFQLKPNCDNVENREHNN